MVHCIEEESHALARRTRRRNGCASRIFLRLRRPRRFLARRSARWRSACEARCPSMRAASGSTTCPMMACDARPARTACAAVRLPDEGHAGGRFGRRGGDWEGACGVLRAETPLRGACAAVQRLLRPAHRRRCTRIDRAGDHRAGGGAALLQKRRLPRPRDRGPAPPPDSVQTLLRAPARCLRGGVSIIGIDCVGERRGRKRIPKAQYCADHGVFIIENLCNLGELLGGEKSARFIARTFPVNFEGMTGLPCGVVAEVDDG